MSDDSTTSNTFQQTVTVLDLPGVTVRTFRLHANEIIDICCTYSGWYVYEISLEEYADATSRENRRRGLEAMFNKPIGFWVREKDPTSDEQYSAEVFSPDGHVSLSVVASPATNDRVRVSFTHWTDESFGGHFLRLLRDLWPGAISVYPKGDNAKNKGGRPPVKAHLSAIQRLKDNQPREKVFQLWVAEYEAEVGISLNDTKTDAAELFKKRVLNQFKKTGGTKPG